MARFPPDLLDPSRYIFTHELQTRFADVDSNRHINNVAMAAAFEDARVRFDRESQLLSQFKDLRVMIVAAHIDYMAEAHYPAPLVIHVAVLDIGRTSWTLGELALQDGRPSAYCRATLCATEGGRPTALPDRLRERLADKLIRPPAQT
jgi:acyl-CoA thioester hydrolase